MTTHDEIDLTPPPRDPVVALLRGAVIWGLMIAYAGIVSCGVALIGYHIGRAVMRALLM